MSRSLHEHVDAQVRVQQSLSWPTLLGVLLAIATALGSALTVWTTTREEITALRTDQAHLRADLVRVEAASRELKGDIRADLAELKIEVRELRDAINGLHIGSRHSGR